MFIKLCLHYKVMIDTGNIDDIVLILFNAIVFTAYAVASKRIKYTFT